MLVASVLTALSSLAIYRVLEGYTLPMALKRRMMKKTLLRWHRLRRTVFAPWGTVSTIARELAQEQWQLYPQDERQLLPTRLGNALKSLETYAMTRYALDSQAFWYELHGVSSLALRQDVDDTRASVDFFVGLTLILESSGPLPYRLAWPPNGTPPPSLLECSLWRRCPSAIEEL